MSKRKCCGTRIAAITVALLASHFAAASQSSVDEIFKRWNTQSPGCAVAASVAGKTRVSPAYGMADLEHDARITPDTIFEAGSVSKQFTAAAILLLVRDGKLSLDDQARQYVPELPNYGYSLTVRDLLMH